MSAKIGEYQLRMANGAKLEEILNDHAGDLADALQARADAWTNKDDRLNQAVATGLELAAEQVRQNRV